LLKICEGQRLQRLRPLPRTVSHAQDLHFRLQNAIAHDEGRALNDEFACAFDAPDTPNVRRTRQTMRRKPDNPHHALRGPMDCEV
jgi:hypothetical protein